MTGGRVDPQSQIIIETLTRRVTGLEADLLAVRRGEQALQESERRYRRLFESAKDGILILDAETGEVVDANPFLLQLLGYTQDELCGMHIWDVGAFKDIAASKHAYRALQDHDYIRYNDLPLETRSGQLVAVEFVSNVYLVDQRRVIQCSIRDITEAKRAAAEHKQLMAAIAQVGDVILMTDPQGEIQFVNPAFERSTGYMRDEVIGKNPRLLKSGTQDESFYDDLWTTIVGGRTWSGRLVNKRKDGTLFTEAATISPVRDPAGRVVNFVAVKRDITEKLRLAAQFHQAQKMEAVGLLAGGVAHDYNNMLSVILGYTDLALNKLDPTHPLHADLVEIAKAAKRSTEITRQLLAFARKQTVVPEVLDLNHNAASMLKMLRRLVGEDIDLVWRPAADPCLAMMDPVQADQVLVNLCVNARDAIADVGKIVIETGNAVFDDAYCADHPGFLAGDYVLLVVSDDGCGMAKEVLDHVFEPFYTTKEMGRGTGLGLATVYGIVKQNQGFINVYSEPGHGTTVRIYLPRHLGPAVKSAAVEAVALPLSHGETVLVVEDEPALLQMDRVILEKLGYAVLAARSPGDALDLIEEHGSKIHLLITDVVMPGMNGRVLVERVHAHCPDMRVLYMSGYTADVIAHRGVLDEGVNFIQKPFLMRDLGVKIREALRDTTAQPGVAADKNDGGA